MGVHVCVCLYVCMCKIIRRKTKKKQEEKYVCKKRVY